MWLVWGLICFVEYVSPICFVTKKKNLSVIRFQWRLLHYNLQLNPTIEEHFQPLKCYTLSTAVTGWKRTQVGPCWRGKKTTDGKATTRSYVCSSCKQTYDALACASPHLGSSAHDRVLNGQHKPPLKINIRILSSVMYKHCDNVGFRKTYTNKFPPRGSENCIYR